MMIRSSQRLPFRLIAGVFCAGVLLLFESALVPAADLTVEKTEGGYAIKHNGQLFAEYIARSGNKPIVWPIIGPNGKRMTRSWPMDESQADEKRDHPHQRSLWFTHGKVNGIDFWSMLAGAGSTEHRRFVKAEGGPTAVIITDNDWLAPDGRKVLEDTRKLVFAVQDDTRTIDFQIELKATAGPVEFGDTKEGSFGVRVPQSVSVDARQGGKIVNSEGLTDKEAWGQRARWVDYHGPVEGETAGIAIVEHPANFAYPTRWHVRPYGLFAANPFGSKEFGLLEEGGRKVASGETLTLRYRVILHRGDEKTANIAAAAEAYAAKKD